MELELKYKKALSENGIKESELPEDAKIGIETITNSIKAVNMLEKKGKKVGDKAIMKIKAMDKWVYYEILDFMEDADENEDMPYDEDEIIEDVKDSDDEIDEDEDEEDEEDEEDDNEAKPNNFKPDSSKGIVIEQELKKLYESNKTKLTLSELKNLAKETYNVVFDGYDKDEENGIETTHYSLIEMDEQEFELTKK